MVNDLDRLIHQALREDYAFRDITTLAVVPREKFMTARLIAKKHGVICGLGIFKRVFTVLDGRCRVKMLVADGDLVRPGQDIAALKGPARSILSGERTALNFIQHLSGIASLTREFVSLVQGTAARVYDTRKTLPGLRELAKYAVRCGGGENHRFNLMDMALIKDNHLQMIDDLGAAVRRIRKKKPGIRVEVECENLVQVEKALVAGSDIIMLDNMSIPVLKKAIAFISRYAAAQKKRKPEIEISGGVDLKSVRRYARLGVTRISVGALTHSSPALDISLEMETSGR